MNIFQTLAEKRKALPWNRHDEYLTVSGRFLSGDHAAFVLSPEIAGQEALASRAKKIIYRNNGICNSWNADPTAYKRFSYKRGVEAILTLAICLGIAAGFIAMLAGMFLFVLRDKTVWLPPLFIVSTSVVLVVLAVNLFIDKAPDSPGEAQEHLITKVKLDGERYPLLDKLRNTPITPHSETSDQADSYYDIQKFLALSQLKHDAGDSKDASRYLNLARAALAGQQAEADKAQTAQAKADAARKTAQAKMLLRQLEQRPEPEGTTIRENPSPDRFSVYSGGRKPEPDMVSSPPVDNGLYENYPAQ